MARKNIWIKEEDLQAWEQISNKSEFVSQAINSTKKSVTKKTARKGSEEINELFDYWQQTVGYAIKSKQKANRYACSNLLKANGKQGVIQLINAVHVAHNDKYAPRISDFTSLQADMHKLLSWAKTKNNTNKTMEII